MIGQKQTKEDMKKKRIHSAPECHAAVGSSFWVSRIALFLLLLFMSGTSCNDAAACTSDNLLCQLLRGISNSTPSGLPPNLINSPCDGFRCGSSECLQFKQVCNQVPDCADSSDENPAACINRTCNLVMDLSDLKQLGSGLVRLESVVRSWRCDNGECISDVYRCDGQRNCADGSDETPLACFDRSCTTAQFTCKTGQCIRRTSQCDGKRDCFDGSDEDRNVCRIYRRNRPRVICPARVMNYCADRAQCYQKRQHCNGKVDCYDGSDEDPQTCGYNERPAPITVPPTTTAPPIIIPPTTPAPPITTPPTIPAPRITTPAPHTPTPSTPVHIQPVTSNVEFLDVEEEDFTRCEPPSCPCSLPGMRHMCLPCHNIANVTDTCIKLQSEEPVCSLKLLQRDIKVDILSCGGQGLQQDFGIFERNSYECVTAGDWVPVLTVVMADCWSSATLVLRCHSDGTWGEYGVMTSDSERMEYICQPRHINSPLCGRKPRYQKTGMTLDLEKFYTSRRNLHPWLLGLKKRERYECSATLITSTWLITAAHCVIRSQESHNETLDPRNLKVQLTSQRRSDRFVSEVVVHPEYRPGRRPLNDIALIRLERPLTISDRMYPACVDLDGIGFRISPFAMTFSRNNGDNVYKYKTVLQQVDPQCHSPVSHCRSLNIEDSQFCGIDLDEENHLPGGSSGGPFMQNLGSDHNESWAVSGIVSFSVEKQLCGLPITVYTAVYLSKEWIQDVIYNGPLF